MATSLNKSLPRAILFDIDGTLIDSQGAGGKALLAALRIVFDLPHARPVALHGRTDAGIMSELLKVNGIEATTENLDRLSQRYFAILPGELARQGGRILPGVVDLLTRLVATTECYVGLLTGNLPHSAQLKLQHFGLWNTFEFGIFGDQAEHRPHLAESARREVNNRSGRELPANRIILIGDTPLDVELALAMQARCLGVTTGGFEAQTLLAAGACRAVKDLSRTAEIIDWIFEQTELK